MVQWRLASSMQTRCRCHGRPDTPVGCAGARQECRAYRQIIEKLTNFAQEWKEVCEETL